jgi:hypothetical protein
MIAMPFKSHTQMSTEQDPLTNYNTSQGKRMDYELECGIKLKHGSKKGNIILSTD